MNRSIKKLLKKNVPPVLISLFVRTRNTARDIHKTILRKLYSHDPFKLALYNLNEDSGAWYQTFSYNGESVYFKSWKNSYVGSILRETYVERAYDWFFSGKKDLIVVDLGANVGLFTQYARRFSKRVIAVEPSQETFSFLQRAKKDNHWANVDIVNAAIADSSNDSVTFFHNESNTTMRSLNPLMSDGSATETVKTMSLSDLFSSQHITSVDFMKIDVEGAELEIVRSKGFRDVIPLVRCIELEIHFRGAYEEEILNILKDCGLITKKIRTTANVYIATKEGTELRDIPTT